MACKVRFLLQRGAGPLLLGALLFLPGSVSLGTGQSPAMPPLPGSVRQPRLPGLSNDDPGMGGPDPAKLARLQEDDRRKRLLADTARLVALSNDLQTEVQKSSRDELSLDVVRKAAEIEKLAHDVKERMKS